MYTVDYTRRVNELPEDLRLRFINLQHMSTVIRLDEHTWGVRSSAGQSPWLFGTLAEVTEVLATLPQHEPYIPRGAPDKLPELDLSDFSSIKLIL